MVGWKGTVAKRAAVWLGIGLGCVGTGEAAFPPRVFAPYIACWTPLSPSALARATGHRFYTLAFLISNGSANSAPYWDGKTALAADKYKTDIADLRALGGDVIVAFGGQGGKELALVHGSVASLQSAYQAAITKYGLTRLDFDIEGDAIFDTAANTRRNQALAGLQRAQPSLQVQYTIPSTDPAQGFTASTVKLLANAKANGVKVAVVNVMAMNYAPDFCGDMGQAAVTVAAKARAQLASLGMDAQVGITPMIGKNDFGCEVFTLDDARETYGYAAPQAYVGLLSFWVMDADPQNAFLNIFSPFQNAQVVSMARPAGGSLPYRSPAYLVSGRKLPRKSYPVPAVIWIKP